MMLTHSQQDKLKRAIRSDDPSNFEPHYNEYIDSNPNYLIRIGGDPTKLTTMLMYALDNRCYRIASYLVSIGATVSLCGNFQNQNLFIYLDQLPATLFFLALNGVTNLQELHYELQVTSPKDEAKEEGKQDYLIDNPHLVIGYDPANPSDHNPDKTAHFEEVFQVYRRHTETMQHMDDVQLAISYEAIAKIGHPREYKALTWILGLAIEYYLKEFERLQTQQTIIGNQNSHSYQQLQSQKEEIQAHISKLNAVLINPETQAESFCLDFPAPESETPTPQRGGEWHQARLTMAIREVRDSFANQAQAAAEEKDTQTLGDAEANEQTALLDSDHSSSDSGSQPRDSDVEAGWVWVKQNAAAFYHNIMGTGADAKPSSTPAPTKDGSK